MSRDNFIIINGGSNGDIKKALRQWIELYSDDLDFNIKFELYKNGDENHIIVVDKRLNNEKFNFLVNYLCYPEGIEYKVKIEGYTTALDSKLYPTHLLNKKLLTYISENDKEFDNVLVTTEDNEVYKIDFGGKVTKINKTNTFKLPDIDFERLSHPERISLNKDNLKEKKKNDSKRSIEKRFKIILFVISGILIITSLTLFIDKDISVKIITWLGIGILVWFLSDYEMLQINKFYNYSFFISIVFLCYVLFVKYKFLSSNIEHIEFISLIPISLLIIQKPLRLIFIRTINREPIVEKSSPTFIDFVYSMILTLSTFGLSFVLVNLMK